MKTDSQLQQDVMAELKWEPLLHAAEIGVSAKDGIITLTGTVDGYGKKSEAEDAVKRVAGVKAVVEKHRDQIPQHLGEEGRWRHCHRSRQRPEVELGSSKGNSQGKSRKGMGYA
ncbi:MAG: BON domain-containing protein [Steroidobacteraceae bacterium]